MIEEIEQRAALIGSCAWSVLPSKAKVKRDYSNKHSVCVKKSEWRHCRNESTEKHLFDAKYLVRDRLFSPVSCSRNTNTQNHFIWLEKCASGGCMDVVTLHALLR